MLKKFTDGLLFGLGFGVALIILYMIGMTFAMPRIFPGGDVVESRHENVSVTKKQAAEKPVSPDGEYSFFKEPQGQGRIPEKGGILAMAVTGATHDSTRPGTYQLWVTESALWQIRTTGDKVEAVELPRPENPTTSSLNMMILERIGSGSTSALTVSAEEMEMIRSKGESRHGTTLNGKLGITKEGAVFVLPDAFGT